MTKKPRIHRAALLLALLLTACTIQINSPAPTAPPAIPARALLLDARAFPQYWEADPCAPDCARDEGINHALRSFHRPSVAGHVIQDVFYLGSPEAAHQKFRLYRETDYRPLPTPKRTFVTPQEIQYTSARADEYYLGCGVDHVPACRAIFRYGAYFISFYIDIDGGTNEGLQITEVEPILHAMDEHAAQVLHLPK